MLWRRLGFNGILSIPNQGFTRFPGRAGNFAGNCKHLSIPNRGLRSSRSKSNAKPSSFLDNDNSLPVNSVVWKYQGS